MAVDEQMEMAFGEKPEVDPVSGNEVPTGSLPEEVRDDIPAQLSEGEYVIPADVVRYYGVRFFEQLRTKAKQGWDAMEQNGRIGGEPVGMETIEPEDDLPFDISELEVYDDEEGEMPEMNRGGYISGYQEGGVASYTAPPAPTGSGIEVRPYEGPNGEVMYVQFIGNKPISYIPPGYKPKGTVAEEVAEAVEQPSQDPMRDRGDNGIEPPEEVDWSTAKPEEFEAYMKQRDSKGFRRVQVGSLALGSIGAAFNVATRAQYNNMKTGLQEQIDKAREEGDEETLSKLSNIQQGIEKYEEENPRSAGKSAVFGGGTSMRDRLEDTDESGEVGFGDTWLGDLLGFDEDGLGVQGASLADSRKGARRGVDVDADKGGDNDTGNGGSRSDNSNVGNWGGDRDNDGVPNAFDFDDGVGWADRNTPDKEDDKEK